MPFQIAADAQHRSYSCRRTHRHNHIPWLSMTHCPPFKSSLLLKRTLKSFTVSKMAQIKPGRSQMKSQISWYAFQLKTLSCPRWQVQLDTFKYIFKSMRCLLLSFTSPPPPPQQVWCPLSNLGELHDTSTQPAILAISTDCSSRSSSFCKQRQLGRPPNLKTLLDTWVVCGNQNLDIWVIQPLLLQHTYQHLETDQNTNMLTQKPMMIWGQYEVLH